MSAVDPTSAATQLIEQMQAMRTRAAGSDIADTNAVSTDFAALMKHYVDNVNTAQQQARALAADFESGASNVQLVDVMVSMQKSRIAFEALMQVRNRFLSAYQEIMSMQV